VSFGRGTSTPSGPYVASGKIVKVEPVVKPKKSGGTYTVNIATLDTGVEVDFGFKPCPYSAGDLVAFEVMKEYGSYKYKSDTPPASGLPVATPKVVRIGGGSTSGGAAVAVVTAAFPIPRESRETAIIRQNALTNAAKIAADCCANGIPVTTDLSSMDDYADAVIKLAYKLTAFSSGNLDHMLQEKVADVVPVTAKKTVNKKTAE
jgi:hypothetical protein